MFGSPSRRVVLLGAAGALAIVACSSGGAPEKASVAVEPSVAVDDSSAAPNALPVRDGPRRATTGTVPHVQLDASPDSEVDAELRRRAIQLPGVEERPSQLSLPGARGLVLSGDLDIAIPGVIGPSREFAHIHPDGSLHVWLPVQRALEVHDTRWGEIHPWVDRDGFWDGVVMVYTPETLEEVDITMQILVDSYNFVTGSTIDAT